MSNRFFRRTALHAALLALPVFAISAQAADIPQVKITVNDKQCEPMALSIPAGKHSLLCTMSAKKGWSGRS